MNLMVQFIPDKNAADTKNAFVATKEILRNKLLLTQHELAEP